MLYNQPIILFLILEKLNIKLWFSKKCNLNVFFYLISIIQIKTLNYILKNELFLGFSTLIEISAIEQNYFFSLSNKYSIYIYYIYYNYYFKSKFIFLYNYKNKCLSIDDIFNNSNWLERETGEMYNITYLQKLDTRKLLLDYSKLEAPLLKNYITTGIVDLFFNILENQVVAEINTSIEL